MDTAPQPPAVRITPHLMFGLLIILIGVVFTLDNLGIVAADHLLDYWPAGLILIGLAKLWQVQNGHGRPVGGVLFIIVGTWMLLYTRGIVGVSIINLWPLLLVLAGGAVVWHSIRGPGRRPVAGSDSIINAVAVLSGVHRGSNAGHFRGGELTAFMGGCEIDLRRAAIHGEAVLDVFVMWGGIDITVPENWRVVGQVTPIMGGFEDATRAPQDAREHTLIIRGVLLMGGIEVKN